MGEQGKGKGLGEQNLKWAITTLVTVSGCFCQIFRFCSPLLLDKTKASKLSIPSQARDPLLMHAKRKTHVWANGSCVWASTDGSWRPQIGGRRTRVRLLFQGSFPQGFATSSSSSARPSANPLMVAVFGFYNLQVPSLAW